MNVFNGCLSNEPWGSLLHGRLQCHRTAAICVNQHRILQDSAQNSFWLKDSQLQSLEYFPPKALFAASLRLTPNPAIIHLDEAKEFLLINASLQETQRRVPTSSRHDALNATPLVRVRETRSAQTCSGCSVVRLVKLRVSHTPMPTRPRELSGTTILSYVVTKMF